MKNGDVMKKEKMPEILLSETIKDTINGIYIGSNKFKEFKLHRHDYYEFEYILRGNGSCFINKKEYKFNAGDLIFVNPLDFHEYMAYEEISTITVHFNINNLDPELIDIVNINTCIMHATDKMRQCFFDLLDEKKEKREFSFLSYKNLLERIVILFMRGQCINVNRELPKGIVYAVGYINQNFSKNLGLKALSEKFGYSEAHFCRLFKKLTGKTFVEYLTNVRVMYAKNLLLGKDYTVTQICYESGFGSIRSLNRAFRDKYGCSLTEYRKNIQDKK